MILDDLARALSVSGDIPSVSITQTKVSVPTKDEEDEGVRITNSMPGLVKVGAAVSYMIFIENRCIIREL